MQADLDRVFLSAKPGLPIWTNREVAALLEQSGAARGARVHVIGHGDAFEAGGLRVHCYGEWHAPIYPGIPQVRNTGFLIDGRLFHPGDALHRPGRPDRAPAAPVDRLLHQDQPVSRLRQAAQAVPGRADPRRHPHPGRSAG